MKRFSKLTILLCNMLVCFGPTYAAVGFDTDDARTFLGPTFRLGFSSAFNSTMAFSIAGEAAPKNMRIGGTLGWLLTPEQRIKILLNIFGKISLIAFLQAILINGLIKVH